MECSVCYDDATSTCKLMCGHLFCMSCIKQWYLKSDEETTCPMCRQKLYFKGMHKYCEKWEEERHEEQIEKVYSNLFDKTIEEAQEWMNDKIHNKWIIYNLEIMEYFFNKYKKMQWDYWEDFEDAVNDEEEYVNSSFPSIYYELLMKDMSLIKFSKNNPKHLPNVHSIFV